MTQNFQSTTPNKSYHMGYMDVSTGWQQFVFTKQLGKIPAGGTFGDASFLNFAIDTTHAPETTYSGIGLTQDALFGETVNYNGVLSIAQVQVVEGRTVPEFQRANEADELERAQRFYQISQNGWNGFATNLQTFGNTSLFPVKMRVTPSCVAASDILTSVAFPNASVLDISNHGITSTLTTDGYMVSRQATQTVDAAYMGQYEFDSEFNTD